MNDARWTIAGLGRATPWLNSLRRHIGRAGVKSSSLNNDKTDQDSADAKVSRGGLGSGIAYLAYFKMYLHKNSIKRAYKSLLWAIITSAVQLLS